MPENATPATEVTPDGQSASGHMIPKARFDEVNNAKKSLEQRLSVIEAEREAARQEALKKAGDFTTLETEYKQKLAAAEAKVAELEPVVTDLKNQQTAAREAQIASLPESHRGIASALPADKLPEYVALVTGNKGPTIKPVAPGAPVTPPGRATPEEIMKGVREHGTQWLKDNANRLT